MSGILNYIIDALYTLPGILVGLSFHEWGHAYAAYKRGDPTARNLGRMTVNPFAHIDPIGFLSLLVLGFGWAKPVPVSTRNFKSPRKDELIVSLAGIIVNLILGVVFLILWFVLGSLPVSNSILNTIVYYCFYINFSLAVFNLLPIPPLDGSKILSAVLPARIYFKIMQYEQYGFIILIILLNLPVFDNLLSFLQQGILNVFIWIIELLPFF